MADDVVGKSGDDGSGTEVTSPTTLDAPAPGGVEDPDVHGGSRDDATVVPDPQDAVVAPGSDGAASSSPGRWASQRDSGTTGGEPYPWPVVAHDDHPVSPAPVPGVPDVQVNQYGPGNQPVKQLTDPHRVTTVVSVVVCVIGLIGVAVFMLLSNGSTETYTGFGTSVESEVVYVDMLAAAVVSGVIAAAGFVGTVISDVASRQWRERHGLAK